MRIICLSVIVLFFFTSKAECIMEQNVSSSVERVTVFFRGAELVHTAKAVLTKGSNEVCVEGLSPDADLSSIKVKATGAVVSAFAFSVNHLGQTALSAEAQKLKDALQQQQKAVEAISIEIKIAAATLSLLQKSVEKTASGSENGLSIDDLVKTIAYYQSKAAEIEKTLSEKRERQAEMNKRTQELQAQFDQEALKNNKRTGLLKLSLTAPADRQCELRVSYYTASASWTPYHDIQISETDKPVKIVSKASVRQVTGINWEKVHISLSTAVPSTGKVAPLFHAWFLQYYEPMPRRDMKKSVVMLEAAQNSYSYETLEEKAFEPDLADLAPQSMNDHVSRSENELNATFDIDLPYTIPGNGKEQNLELKTQEVAATFKYYCAPKLDYETYLLAEIAEWEKLNLLSGNANVTYDGTYLGEAYIDAASTQTNLSLTLGADKRVAVKREKLKDFSSTGFFGSEVKQEFAWQITVRNNRNTAIRMVLKDQYPISTIKEVTVELSKDSTPPTVNKTDLGVVSWENDMKAGETQVFKFIYTVKYPKNKTLNL
jgi:uncharacterized protein (TIGR02231 family)